MALTLTIENETSLPDGGPLSVTLSGGRGLDIGRDQHLDWALPDPTRSISGRHCEIRFRDNAYWLRDISTNGTYVNGSSNRVQSPYRLQHGDRLEIGHYIIAVTIDDAGRQAAAEPPAPAYAPQPDQLWSSAGDEAPPIPRRDFLPPGKHSPVHAGFIDWATDIPAPSAAPVAPTPPLSHTAQPAEDFAWAPYQPPPAAPDEPVAPIPTPRRPPASGAAAANPWDEPAAATPPPTPVMAEPPRQASPPPMPSISPTEFVQRFAKGAGLPTDALAWQDPGAFAEQLGGLRRLVAIEL